MNRRGAAVVFVVTILAVPVFTVVSAGAQNEAGQVLLQGTFSTTSETPGDMERTAPLTSPDVTGGPAKGKAEIELSRTFPKR